MMQLGSRLRMVLRTMLRRWAPRVEKVECMVAGWIGDEMETSLSTQA
jgi:hypothetical protein